MSQCWLESAGRNTELSGGNLRKYIQNLKNMQITTSKFLPLPYNPWKYAHRDILLPRLDPTEIIRDVSKDMNLFIALVFVRKK